MKQEDVLSPVLFNLPLVHAISKVQESQVGIEWGTSASGLC
jgi:hypothetical protein